jgi:hypothetical protein
MRDTFKTKSDLPHYKDQSRPFRRDGEARSDRSPAPTARLPSSATETILPIAEAVPVDAEANHAIDINQPTSLVPFNNTSSKVIGSTSEDATPTVYIVDIAV